MSHGIVSGGAGAAAAAAVVDSSSLNSQSATTEYREVHWTSNVMDSSRVSTCLISMLLIVYGSFRSLNIEQEAREREQKKRSESMMNLITGEPVEQETNKFATLDTMHALCLPLGASVSLLVMFFFFDSMQLLFAVCTAIIATVALAFLLLPMCQYIIRPCTDGNRISFGICGRFTAGELFSFALSVSIVCIWVLTGHWLLMDAMGMGLCVAFIAFVRLPSLKVSTLLLTGLLIYDVFWVFFSSYIFSTNVMVKVATRPADNPVGIVARKLNLGSIVKEPPKLNLPGKLVFPSIHNSGHFSMLGLGDIVMPGLLLCFVLRYDAYKKSQGVTTDPTLQPPKGVGSRLTYFHCSLLGYFLGLLTATVSSEIFKAAQPALLYLVPFTLLPLLTMAYLKGDLRRMWSEPFITQQPSKQLEV
ncbi:signal peptide peptidase-like 3 [Anastrepha ludens]|uniref:signal peptide peptidase-like 3 n=1 Tax=Anastrepha ludens TaxID=28586 RepID=UPI0023AF40D5|nr:signal peptide peptidase-like 3 [Anastrepha ludens]XP_053968722.1 signal peptide peptidase-like 3 [Anastrepha ludens]XP_053968728.1 signal peptide peptidase-like 3 [Anastrepha ludens]XP_053968729.1 signal peptide peptidase-like 3 [Anastrepha ludens]XP_053968731.1 signal peptide peptidase-like 3 [Anastrepha ludens]